MDPLSSLSTVPVPQEPKNFFFEALGFSQPCNPNPRYMFYILHSPLIPSLSLSRPTFFLDVSAPFQNVTNLHRRAFFLSRPHSKFWFYTFHAIFQCKLWFLTAYLFRGVLSIHASFFYYFRERRLYKL